MKLDEFHWHEAIDRISIIQDLIQISLNEHPLFEAHGHLQDKADQVQLLLVTLQAEILSMREGGK